MEIFTPNTLNIGNYSYPFLSTFSDWILYSLSFDDLSAQPEQYSISWVKDTKIFFLCAYRADGSLYKYDDFCHALNLDFDWSIGGFKVSKRFSRIMRPYRYFAFMSPDEIAVNHDPKLDSIIWDGSGQISRQLLLKIAEQCPHLTNRQRQEMANHQRFELTMMTSQGQEKCHVQVMDDMTAYDIVLPFDSAKPEIKYYGDNVFIGLVPFYGHKTMRLDIQSLVNLYPFFQPAELLKYAKLESQLFIEGIKGNRYAELFNRIEKLDTFQDMEKLKKWYLADYLASGGNLNWFTGTVKAMARQHTMRLTSNAGGKELHGRKNYRFPIAGCNYYITPAEIAGKTVAKGQALIDQKRQSIFVNGEDWKNFIVESLGGCDGDDGVWIHQFNDKADNGKAKLLIWRSPNQLGEYILLEPADNCPVIEWETPSNLKNIGFVDNDSTLLPPHIFKQEHKYIYDLPKPEMPEDPTHLEAIESALINAMDNKGILGGYCNILLTIKALKGHLPYELPARLEDVIDGTVKDGRSLLMVSKWCHGIALYIAKNNMSLSPYLVDRVAPALSQNKKFRNYKFRIDPRHWLTLLIDDMKAHIEDFTSQVNSLLIYCKMPTHLIKHAQQHINKGKILANIYQATRKNTRDHAQAINTTLTTLNNMSRSERNAHILGLLLHSESNSIVWSADIAPLTLDALRSINVLGIYYWHEVENKAVFDIDRSQAHTQTATTLQANGTWFEYAKLQGMEAEKMADIDKTTRKELKEKMQSLAPSFVGQSLTVLELGNRQIIATRKGFIIGHIEKAKTGILENGQVYNVAFATAKDGNMILSLV